jgi:hypothetical protein
MIGKKYNGSRGDERGGGISNRFKRGDGRRKGEM